MDQTLLLTVLGLLFLVGLGADLLGRFSPLPRVTLLLLAGLALGPAGFAILPDSFIDSWFSTLTSVALALIGFLLGHELSVKAMKDRGVMVLGITMAKVVGAAAAVAVALLLLGTDPVLALVLASIAPATAPAATYDVVHEIGATGEFPETLLSVVAVDDVIALLMFTIMLAAAGGLSGEAAIGSGLLAGLEEIGASLSVGFILGIPMAYLSGRLLPGEPTLAEALGFVLVSAGLSGWLELSPTLTAMTMGATVASLAAHHERPFNAIEGIEWPFMILFFVLAGASLELDALLLVGGITVVYIASRAIGTYVGTRVGCDLYNTSPAMKRWLGLALLPQAGVAIGMALIASQRLPEVGAVVLPVVLASTVVLEIVAPVLSRYAIRAAERTV